MLWFLLKVALSLAVLVAALFGFGLVLMFFCAAMDAARRRRHLEEIRRPAVTNPPPREGLSDPLQPAPAHLRD